ncbi:hypothetical protein J437_LFUL012520 [Ladona fulva]|uniref:Uncharacterized protein n=1 Tax=Ladona fulva TaxID=123851 RepID=A0A8K0K5L6_LADFU|nr:hypothetical protein J437_LFUL012520 [Ladona fulva]
MNAIGVRNWREIAIRREEWRKTLQKAKTHTGISLHSKSRISDYSLDIDCAVLPQITGLLPIAYVNIANWNIPQGLRLADEHFYQHNHIDLLLGAQVFMKH